MCTVTRSAIENNGNIGYAINTQSQKAQILCNLAIIEIPEPLSLTISHVCSEIFLGHTHAHYLIMLKSFSRHRITITVAIITDCCNAKIQMKEVPEAQM